MDKLVLIDSNSLLNKAFYALPPLTSKSGLPTNAVLGYLNMLTKIIKDIKPTHIIATFDVKAPTFRKELYADYKAQRKPMPEELVAQMPIVKEMLKRMDIQIVELAGYEADDIIGTLAHKCRFSTIIVTGDKDSLQLVSDTTTVMLAKRGITDVIEYTPERLREDGLTASQVIDLKSLMGDASDNIPGVAGVGEKTAMTLIADYGNLDGVYANIDKIKGKLKEKLDTSRDIAYLSHRLATIDIDAPVEFVAEDCTLKYPLDGAVLPYLEELNFKTAIARLEFTGAKVEKRATVEVTSHIVDSNTSFDELVSIILETKSLAIFIDNNELILSPSATAEYTIKPPSGFLDVAVDMDYVIDKIRYLAGLDGITTIFYDSKAMMHYLQTSDFKRFYDISLMAYLIDASKPYKDLRAIIEEYGYSSDNLASKLHLLAGELELLLLERRLANLYYDLELPLVKVLYSMEVQGVKVDRPLMNILSEQYSRQIKSLSDEIYQLAGETFKINSSQQLAVILFDKLNLKHGKKNKTGSYSTNVEILELLRYEHPIVDKVLEYRSVSKLQSTYIIGLESLLDANDKLHTNFNQNITATGRLSTTEPNLQNIPVRKPEGRELRKMFISSPGNTIVAADYSQIELRLLAHFSQDERLIEAYNNDEDIHRLTASLIFNVPFDSVTQELRSRAKAVNFGIIYGISDYGLSSDVGCSVAEARQFIASYFLTYPTVKTYLDSSIAYGRKHGYVKTILDRIRYIPDINSSNYNLRSFAERVAMNMPLQGSASDIIKKAMIMVYDKIISEGLSAKMVLQIHDELLLDCPLDEVDKVSRILEDCMVNAVKLNVNLKADVKVGASWYDTK